MAMDPDDASRAEQVGRGPVRVVTRNVTPPSTRRTRSLARNSEPLLSSRIPGAAAT